MYYFKYLFNLTLQIQIHSTQVEYTLWIILLNNGKKRVFAAYYDVTMQLNFHFLDVVFSILLDICLNGLIMNENLWLQCIKLLMFDLRAPNKSIKVESCLNCLYDIYLRKGGHSGILDTFSLHGALQWNSDHTFEIHPVADKLAMWCQKLGFWALFI